MTNLTVLDLSNNMICQVELLGELVSLKTLFLKNNHVTDIRPLLALGQLMELDLENNEIFSIKEVDAWSLHPSLIVFNLKSNAILT
jgi:Leucine-rich repeat (LRR) protein